MDYGESRYQIIWMEGQILSQAGKTILIKSKLTGILMFTIQVIKIPNYIAKEINKKTQRLFLA